MGLSKAVVKNRVLILMIALILLVPAVFGMLGTRINYDMLDYLPSDMDTVIGQETLKEDFGKGAFSFIVVQDMPVQEVAQLKEKIQQVDHVESVLWYDSVADLSIPMELLPDKLYNEFNTDDATMLAVFFDSATSEDVTMDAIREIRSIAGKQCFVSGMSALVTDLKDLCEQEEPIYVALAVACACAAMMLLLDGWLVPFVFLASIGMAIVYNLGSNFFLGEISYITKALSAVLQLAVTMDYSIFLYHRYEEERPNYDDERDAMAQQLSIFQTEPEAVAEVEAEPIDPDEIRRQAEEETRQQMAAAFAEERTQLEAKHKAAMSEAVLKAEQAAAAEVRKVKADAKKQAEAETRQQVAQAREEAAKAAAAQQEAKYRAKLDQAKQAEEEAQRRAETMAKQMEASSDENAVRFFMLFEQLQQKVEDMKAITETMRETSIENAEKFLNALRGALSAIMANLEGGGSNVG